MVSVSTLMSLKILQSRQLRGLFSHPTPPVSEDSESEEEGEWRLESESEKGGDSVPDSAIPAVSDAELVGCTKSDSLILGSGNFKLSKSADGDNLTEYSVGEKLIKSCSTFRAQRVGHKATSHSSQKTTSQGNSQWKNGLGFTYPLLGLQQFRPIPQLVDGSGCLSA